MAIKKSLGFREVICGSRRLQSAIGVSEIRWKYGRNTVVIK